MLPPGWIEVTDPNSGRLYYANPTTRETSWDPPIFVPPSGPPPAVSPAASAVIMSISSSSPVPQVQVGINHNSHQNIINPQHTINQTHPRHQKQQYPMINTTTVSPSGMSSINSHTNSSTTVTINNNSNNKAPISSQQLRTTTTNNSVQKKQVLQDPAVSGMLIVPSVCAMMEQQKQNNNNNSLSSSLELENLSAGTIADLCNITRDHLIMESRKKKALLMFHKKTLKNKNGDESLENDDNIENDDDVDNDDEEDFFIAYKEPIQPFTLPIQSKPPHIEVGRVDIRLMELFDKLDNIEKEKQDFLMVTNTNTK